MTAHRAFALALALTPVLPGTSSADEVRAATSTTQSAQGKYVAEVPREKLPEASLEAAARLSAELKRTAEVQPEEGGRIEAVAPTPELYADAVELYQVAAETGSRRQAAHAYNEIGALHLKMGDAEKAVAAFEKIDLQAVPPEQLFIYRLNRAQALERAGAAARAWPEYLAAVEESPAFRPAVDAAWRALAESENDPRAPERAEQLTGLLLERGQHAGLGDVLWPALARWQTPGLFAVLAGWWADAPPDPEERRRLHELAEAGSSLAAQLLTALDDRVFERAARRASAGHLEALERLAGDRLPDWQGEHSGAISALLTALAGEDHRQGELATSFGRNFVAWWLDRSNTQAAADCGALLAASPELDPEGAAIRELVSSAFVSKGQAYAAGDYRNILRMHLLLAGIFAERGIWGSSDDVQSAIFQLEHALEAERRLRREDPESTASPGLHRRLGEAYAAVGDRDLACRHFAQAAEALEARDRVSEAAALEARCSG